MTMCNIYEWLSSLIQYPEGYLEKQESKEKAKENKEVSNKKGKGKGKKRKKVIDSDESDADEKPSKCIKFDSGGTFFPHYYHLICICTYVQCKKHLFVFAIK